MIIVSWNVRGLGNSLKRRRVNEALVDLHPDLIGFQETKLSEVDSRIIAQLTDWSDVGYIFSSSFEQTRGLMCCWNPTCFREVSRVC